MDNDILSLIQYLLATPFSSLEDMEKSSGVTRRQSLYRFEKLNRILKGEHVPAVTFSSTPDKKILLAPETQTALQDLLQRSGGKEAYFFSKEERLIYMYLLLFIHIDYLSLNHFIDALKCSRSTVLTDFRELKAHLEESGIEICNNRKQGYYLEGPEVEIRRFMIQNVIRTLADRHGSQLFDTFIRDWKLDLFGYARQIIAELAQKWNIRMIEARLVEFIYIFIFLKTRLQNGVQNTLPFPDQVETEMIPSLKEYDFTTDLLKQYPETEVFDESDIRYLTSWVIGISYGRFNENTKDRLLIGRMAKNIMLRFEALSGVHLTGNNKIFVQLYAHLRPAYYRLLFRLPIYNPICETIKNEYGELYQLMTETLKPFSVMFHGEIPDDEVAYLTIHFAAAFSKARAEAPVHRKKALVICTNGVGSSTILYNELTQMFPDLQFLPPCDTSHWEDLCTEADIIFTTNQTPLHTVDLSIPVIRVNPVMSVSEKAGINKKVHQWLGTRVPNQPDVDAVMSIISKYAEIRNYDHLYHELLSYFSEAELPDTPSEIRLHLTDMVWPEIIRLHLHASSREDAIRMAYEPMLQQHCVLDKYVDEAARTESGYMVIAKHIALPHTKPEAGAISCALGIGVLDEPIRFGNQENDPVKYIFALSAVDNSTHLAAMAELIRLFNDQDFFTLLDTADDPNEVMAYIRSHL